MTRDELFAAIKETLCVQFEIPEERITLDANLVEDLDLDSIDAIDLVVRMREVTGVRLVPESFKSVRTICDVVDALERAISTNA